ncbi:tri1 [Symbiodinium sp. CCMP2456]|nr:tri1 [Symbiodinium sp. CCMP2456]
MAATEHQLDNGGYVRHPTICKGRLAFVVEEDIWLTECCAKGTPGPKHPRRMTNFGRAAHPLFSPSADYIAFTDSSDLWVLTVKDGRCRRLTWFAMGDLWPAAWKTEQEIAFTSTCEDPFDRSILYTVSTDGGKPKKLFEGEYDAIAFGPAGGILVGRHTKDTPRTLWKGYRGGQHGFLWIDVGCGVFGQVEIKDARGEFCLNISYVTWQHDRLFFIADPDGSGNVWSTGLDGRDLQKHTCHDFFDVRCLRGDLADDLVYTIGGELWHFNLSTSTAERIWLDFGPCHANLPRGLEASAWIDSVVLHPAGHTVSCLCRGSVHEMALWEGPVVQLLQQQHDAEGKKGLEDADSTRPGNSMHCAVRCVAMEYLFSGRLLTVTEAHVDGVNSEPWAFVLHPPPCRPSDRAARADEAAMSPVEILRGFLVDVGSAAQKFTCCEIQGQIQSMTASPAHDAIVIVTSRNQMWVMELLSDGQKPSPEDPCTKLDALITAETRLMDSSEWEEGISDPCWSPDGAWICYCRRCSAHGSSVVLINVETSAQTVVADATFSNRCPAFHPEGLYLAFLSARHFAPLEDAVTADLTFASGTELPFLVLLTSDTPNPFERMLASPAKLDEEADSPTDTDSASETLEEPLQVRIDVENIQTRVLQLPVEPGNYTTCMWTAAGQLLYLREKPFASNPYVVDDEDEPEAKNTLFVFDLDKSKEVQLWDNVTSISTSSDCENVLLCAQDEEDAYFVVKAGAGLPEEDVDMSKPGPESGMLDFDRLSIQVVDIEEWRSMFRTVSCFVSEHLFDEQCGGIDWKDTCNRYWAILPRIRSSVEFEDLCGEMLSELGLSHVSFTLGAEDCDKTRCRHLGIDVSWLNLEGGGAYRVDEVLRGDVWDKEFCGPAARPGVGITEGALILAVNRMRVVEDVPISQMLADTSAEVFLTYVPAHEVPSFAKLQKTVAQHGGADGLRRLRRQSHAAKTHKKHGQAATSGRTAEKGRPRRNREGRASGKADDFERELAALFKHLEISTQHVCRTARIRTAGANTMRNVRMRDLVEARRRNVHESTHGRVGYLYVPDTTRLGFAEFYRCFAQEASRDALIIDLRCNGGGFASELFLKQLQCGFLGWTVPRRGRMPTRCPELCASGKLVLLIDENTCSDGEACAEAFQRFKLGVVVGVRTWGGVTSVGACDLDLLDGSQLVLPDSHYFIPGPTGYGLENWGVMPDILSEWPPNCPAGCLQTVAAPSCQASLERDFIGEAKVFIIGLPSQASGAARI